jgi:hypothetical protein
MHIASELKSSMISVEKGGRPASVGDVLDWELRDRLGIVINSPLGALGAGLLALLCTIAFYDLEKRRRRRPLYGPIYLFHIGRMWGFHGEFDFWPDRKEILVSDRTQTLPMINAHGITHLAVPKGEVRTVTHRYKEPEELLDRLKQAFMYCPTGAVNGQTMVLRSSDDNVIRNFEYTVNLRETLALRESEVMKDPRLQGDTPAAIDARRYVQLMRSRLTEIDDLEPAATHARERVWQAMRQHSLTEEIIQIAPEEVLCLLN